MAARIDKVVTSGQFHLDRLPLLNAARENALQLRHRQLLGAQRHRRRDEQHGERNGAKCGNH